MSTPRLAQTVPYFVMRLQNGKAKALFTVPAHLATSLTVNPVLCRGSSFDLKIDSVSLGQDYEQASSTSTTFLSTEFESPSPEETARAISERVAIRIGSPSPSLGNFLGGMS